MQQPTTAVSITELSDPELMRLWAELRIKLLVTPQDTLAWDQLKSDYDAAIAEYRRRMVRWDA